ncbi:MAG: hypothetical protein HYV48_05215 [Candidatus Omnitrophica bacterium]|nr:hypothetical protein [Candidatus Omnitrophota bacterium]
MFEIHWLKRFDNKIFIACGILLAFSNLVNLYGEVIVLKNGGYLKGEIIGESDLYIKVKCGGIGELTLNRGDVARIDKDADFLSPLELYEKKKNEMDKDSPEAHLEMGNFCVQNRLYVFARSEFKRVLEIDPGYKEVVLERLKDIETREAINRAKYLLEAGDYVEVVRVLESLFSSNSYSKTVEEEAKGLLARASNKMDEVLGTPSASIGSEYMALDKSEAILKLINSAQERVDCSLVMLDNLQVFNSLVMALLRGIEVRIVVDKRNVESNISQIKSMGAKVKEVDFEGRISSLFFVIDGSYLWISPYGVGQASGILGKNYSVRITHLPLVQRYLGRFESLYNGTDNHEGRKGKDFVIEQSMVESYFTPEEDAKTEIIKRINMANDSIEFWTAYFEDKDIYKAIVNRYRAGVKVKGVFERKSERRIDYNKMLKKGLDVRENDKPYSIHGTMLIIDSKIVITGSFVIDREHWRKANQDLLFIYDEDIAKAYREERIKLFF